MRQAQDAAGLGFASLCLSLSLSPLLPVATLVPIGAWQKNPQGAAVIAQTLLHPYCCLYLQTSKKHRKAILFACNSDSVYCLGYRLKARVGGVQDKRERQAEQGLKKKKKRASYTESTIEL